MSRKNTILGLGALAAFGFASMAFAQCPSSPVPPWSTHSEFQGASSISAGGLAGTSCHFESAISAGASGAAFATVSDTTPSAEPRYRAQFVIDKSALTNQQLLEGVTIFTANATNHAGVGAAVRLTIYGNSVAYATVAEGQPGNVASGVATLGAGENVIEFDWVAGNGDGYFKLWVNNDNEANPTSERTNLNNANWVGIDEAYLGLAGPTSQFVSSHAGRVVKFDEFDSRRTTFIGL